MNALNKLVFDYLDGFKDKGIVNIPLQYEVALNELYMMRLATKENGKWYSINYKEWR